MREFWSWLTRAWISRKGVKIEVTFMVGGPLGAPKRQRDARHTRKP